MAIIVFLLLGASNLVYALLLAQSGPLWGVCVCVACGVTCLNIASKEWDEDTKMLQRIRYIESVLATPVDAPPPLAVSFVPLEERAALEPCECCDETAAKP